MRHRASKARATGIEEHYERLLAAQSSSGQSVRAFAEARGLSAATLYSWRRRLGLARCHSQRTAPAEIATADHQPRSRLVEVAISAPRGSDPPTGLVLHLFGVHRVELPADYRADDLRRVVAALSPC